MRLFAVPADGVKGKTWGPSSVHQRSRGHLPLPALARPKPPRFCSSAPDLPPAHQLPHAGNPTAHAHAPADANAHRDKRKPRKSKSQVRPPKELARKRTGSHDDLLYEADEPRRNRTFLLCPFTSTTNIPHQYDTVFDLAADKAKRKGSHGDVKKNLLKSFRSNSLAGLLAVAGNLSSETTELLRDD